MGTVGGWGVKFFFRNSTKFDVCVSYMIATYNGTFFLVPAHWGLGERPKGQISLNLNYKVNFNFFKPNFVHLRTNERYTLNRNYK